MKECCNSLFVKENIIGLVSKYGYEMEQDKRLNDKHSSNYYIKIPKILGENKNFLRELIDLEIRTINYKPQNLNGANYSGYNTWQGSHWTITNINEIFDNSPEMLEEKFSRLLNETILNGWYIILYEFSFKGFKQIYMPIRVLNKWENIIKGYEGEKIRKLIFGN